MTSGIRKSTVKVGGAEKIESERLKPRVILPSFKIIWLQWAFMQIQYQNPNVNLASFRQYHMEQQVFYQKISGLGSWLNCVHLFPYSIYVSRQDVQNCTDFYTRGLG